MTNKQLIKKLDEIRQLIRRGWSRGFPAMTAENRPIAPIDSRAVKWSLDGAVAKVTENSDEYGSIWGALSHMAKPNIKDHTFNLNAWNNDPSRTVKDILHLIDNTINKLEEELKNENFDRCVGYLKLNFDRIPFSSRAIASEAINDAIYATLEYVISNDPATGTIYASDTEKSMDEIAQLIMERVGIIDKNGSYVYH